MPTVHIIDWLGSPNHRSVGISLMRKAHAGSPTQFGLGVSQAALVVGERAGYELRSLVPVYTRVVRARYWLQTKGLRPFERGLRLVRDLALRWTRLTVRARVTVTLKQVLSFGSEINPIVDKAKAYAILTERDPGRLNIMLQFPRQAVTGWHLLDHAGRLCGFALLNVVPKDQGQTRAGKIVDCLLDDVNIQLWQAAMLALTRALIDQGADVVLAYASTPWSAEALLQTGFRSRFAVKFHIRDRNGLIPHAAAFHLTPLEGDYAYT